ncbi:DUF1467 family protein [Maricaulis sp. CAU 1757]
MKRALFLAPVILTGLLWLSGFFIRDGGVGVVNGIVVYLIMWWLVLFMMLPIGVTSQHEDGEIVAGSEPGAPTHHGLGRKAWWTTVATSILWLIYFAVTESGVVGRWMPTGGGW